MTASMSPAEAIIREHSKSFSLASRVLPPEARRHAVALYAWCRRADDAVDLVESPHQAAAVAALRSELEAVYAGDPMRDPVLALFQATVVERRLPERYAQDLLTGMDMDVGGRRYETLDDLLDYCYHVAGCVGLMMCHVMGVKDDSALANAAHLGIAMQLTNICRDVAEDWSMGRLYLPDEVLSEYGCPRLLERLGGEFPEDSTGPMARAIAHLLDLADRFYRSGDAGIGALSWRCSMAIRTARSVYSSIGGRIRAMECDPLRGRAFVTNSSKLLLAAGAVARSAWELPDRAGTRGVSRPTRVALYPQDILPLEVHS